MKSTLHSTQKTLLQRTWHSF